MKIIIFIFTLSACVISYAADNSVKQNSEQQRIPYIIQDLPIYPSHTSPIFYLYRWIKIDDKWIGFLKPECDTNPPQMPKSERED